MNTTRDLDPRLREAIANLEIEGFSFTDEEIDLLQGFIDQGLSEDEEFRALDQYLDRVERQSACVPAE